VTAAEAATTATPLPTTTTCGVFVCFISPAVQRVWWVLTYGLLLLHLSFVRRCTSTANINNIHLGVDCGVRISIVHGTRILTGVTAT